MKYKEKYSNSIGRVLPTPEYIETWIKNPSNHWMKISNRLKYLHLCVDVYERCAKEEELERERSGGANE